MPMMSTWGEQLLARVFAGDRHGVAAALAAMDESERRACAADVVAARDPWLGDEVNGAQLLAEYGVLPPSKLRSIAHGPVRWHEGSKDPRFEQIMRLRPREWRQRLLRRANWRLGLPWPAAYRLVRDGMADSPHTSWYYAASVWHVADWRDDPTWLAGDFWGLFTHEEAGIELSRVSGKEVAYRELADSGRVPRARLLGACVDALERDFQTRATRFYRALFDALEPEPDELAPLADHLFALLASDNRLDVGFALSHLSTVQAAGELDGQSLLNSLAPAMTATTKKHVLSAVRLAATAMRADLDLTTAAVAVLAEGLLHPNTDVQRAVFAELQPYADQLEPDAIALLHAAAEDVDPLILTALDITVTQPAPLRPMTVPGRGPEPPSPEWETPPPAAESPPGEARWHGEWPHLYGWHHGTVTGYCEALLARVRDLWPPSGLHELLSAPTFQGGWIEPAAAARRLWCLNGPVSPWDLAQMVLRLMADTDGAGRLALEHLDSEEAAVARYALGGDARQPDSSTLAPAWIAAEARRDPEAYEHRARPLAAKLLQDRKRLRWQSEPEEPSLPEDPLAALEQLTLPTTNMLPWLATIWPSNLEPIFRMVTRWLWRLRPDGPFPRIEPTIALLADPRVPAGADAGLALAVCLGCKDIGLRTFAADTVATAITRGTVGAEWLGAGLSRALHEYRDVEVGLPDNETVGAVPRRWAGPLDDIARTSVDHAHAVHTAIQLLLASTPTEDRTRLNGVLSLLRQITLTLHTPVENAETRAFLMSLSLRSRGGQIAQDILSAR
jgi:hypothetical protein